MDPDLYRHALAGEDLATLFGFSSRAYMPSVPGEVKRFLDAVNSGRRKTAQKIAPDRYRQCPLEMQEQANTLMKAVNIACALLNSADERDVAQYLRDVKQQRVRPLPEVEQIEELKRRREEYLNEANKNPAKRRVLMLSLGYGELGGVGTVTKELSEALNSRSDYEVDVLSLWPWHQNGRKPFRFTDANGATLRDYETLDDFASSADGQRKYDVVNFQNHVFADYFLGMLKGNTMNLERFLARYDAPRVVLTHCVVARQKLEEYSGRDFSAQEISQRQIMGLCDRVLHLSEDQKRFADSHYPEFSVKTSVIGNGTNPARGIPVDERAERQKKYAPNGEKLGLYLGRLSEEKGIYELVDALPSIKLQRPDFKLLIAGNNGDHHEQALRERLSASQMKEGRDYDFLGWVTDVQEKQRIINASDFMIMPSHYEHFPMAALEAMVQAKPVIISDVEGPRSIFRLRDPTRRLAIPIRKTKRSALVAEAVVHALNDEYELREVGRRAQREVLARYTWDKVAGEYDGIYRELISNRPKREAKPKYKAGVVVTTFNRKGEVDLTIDSLLDQKFDQSYKVVVVDNGSTDGTFEHLVQKYQAVLDYSEDHVIAKRRRFAGDSGRVIIMRARNRHAAIARNSGLRVLYDLGCELFTHQDAVNCASPNKLKTLVGFMDQNKDVGLAHAKVEVVDPAFAKTQPGYRDYESLWASARKFGWTKGDAAGFGYVHDQAVMLRRNVIERLGQHNLYWEGAWNSFDRDFTAKVETAGFKFGFVDEYVASVVLNSTAACREAVASLDDLFAQATTHKNAVNRVDAVMRLAESEEGRARLAAHPKLFNDYFGVIFELAHRRDFEFRFGNYGTAKVLAEELAELCPTPQNKEMLDIITDRILADESS